MPVSLRLIRYHSMMIRVILHSIKVCSGQRVKPQALDITFIDCMNPMPCVQSVLSQRVTVDNTGIQ